tara:strand:- start:524 stop:718 length:195 start_codon:yes stop_codon:yes gene_type:complete
LFQDAQKLGYDYIEAKTSPHKEDKINGLDIINFIEKPNKDRAENQSKIIFIYGIVAYFFLNRGR